MTVDLLRETKIGKTVNKMRNSFAEESRARDLANALIKAWKEVAQPQSKVVAPTKTPSESVQSEPHSAVDNALNALYKGLDAARRKVQGTGKWTH